MVVTEEMVSNMRPGSVVIDVSIDRGGCFETSEITSHEHPIFMKYGVIHYCVPNIPSGFSRTASQAISNVLMPLLLEAGEEGSEADPGTGWDLTKVLAALPPCCPVILHTSNGERGTWMMGEFHLGGWEYHRVAALGDDWIEEHWRRVVRRLLRRSRTP